VYIQRSTKFLPGMMRPCLRAAPARVFLCRSSPKPLSLIWRRSIRHRTRSRMSFLLNEKDETGWIQLTRITPNLGLYAHSRAKRTKTSRHHGVVDVASNTAPRRVVTRSRRSELAPSPSQVVKPRSNRSNQWSPEFLLSSSKSKLSKCNLSVKSLHAALN
jgi:hypothetical protein